MRKTPLATDHIYHIFNRGVNKSKIFFSQRDYKRFLLAAKHYRIKNSKFSYVKPNNDPVSLASPTASIEVNIQPKVEILAYCLMPNHFHFLIKQLSDGGITFYMRRFMNSYAHYVNIKYKRVGPLFQGRFKSVLIESDEQLLHVSRYIHLNPLVSDLVSDLNEHPWSSYFAYVQNEKDGLSSPDLILNSFKTKKNYNQFLLDQEDYARSLEQIKHLVDF